MSLVDDLRAARALIDTPEKWGRGSYKHNETYCALGACRKVFYGAAYGSSGLTLRKGDFLADHNPLATALCAAMPRHIDGHMIHEYNDDPATTHADIMALFDRAISQHSTEGEKK